jgi:hypothetical protein
VLPAVATDVLLLCPKHTQIAIVIPCVTSMLFVMSTLTHMLLPAFCL